MRQHSIRTRTLVLVLGVLTLSLSLISWRGYRDAQHEIEELFDGYLAHASRLLEGMLGSDVGPQHFSSLQRALDAALAAAHGDEMNPEKAGGHRYETKLAFMVLDEEGQVLLRSASAPDGLLQVLTGGGGQPRDMRAMSSWLTGYHSLPLAGHEWRVFLREDLAGTYWLLVAEREDVRGELVDSIALRSMLPDLLGLPLLAVLVWFAIGLGLRPLSQVASLIKARDAESLAPLAIAPLPRELEPIVAALNRLLQQVTDLLEREKRFIADAAHELRTPLAVLRIHAENAMQVPDAADREAALGQLVSGVERATRVVNQMLTLARLEPEALHSRMARFDLRPWVRSELAELIPLALEQDIELDCEVADDGSLQLVGDSGSLGILLQNLVGNALQYTPRGGRVRVSLEEQGNQLLLKVGDSGPGVPVEQRALAFRRFWRLGGGEGAGLGLAIAQRIVELHHGSIAMDTSPLGGLEVQVVLPRNQPVMLVGSVAH